MTAGSWSAGLMYSIGVLCLLGEWRRHSTGLRLCCVHGPLGNHSLMQCIARVRCLPECASWSLPWEAEAALLQTHCITPECT